TKGWVKVEGTPNEMAAITLALRGEGDPVTTDLRTHSGRLTDEFVDFREIFLRRDYSAMLEFLSHTLDGMAVLQLCKKG
ncbi:MAG: hypothetical protein IJV54_14035, partial [Bacteroidales bacterium]|nr:hypothetical protein [Bacteroidales bacterium]